MENLSPHADVEDWQAHLFLEDEAGISAYGPVSSANLDLLVADPLTGELRN